MALWCVQKRSPEKFIQCTACKKWIHGKCSRVKGGLKGGTRYQCPICSGKVQSCMDAEKKLEIQLGEDKIECVEKFCYLGDMLGAGGGVEEASRNRVRCALGKIQ